MTSGEMDDVRLNTPGGADLAGYSWPGLNPHET